MSLIRELWFAVVVMMGLAFGGTFVISTKAARQSAAEQLFVKNVDNATALALSISQMDKDRVTIELLLAAQFDAGHYRSIRLEAPDGQVIVERRDDTSIKGVPAAFVDAVALEVPAGVAQVQDGWQQYGTLILESHDQYVYADLWRGIWRLLGWFTAIALGVGFVGSRLLRRITQPLKGVVEQAEALSQRRFITQPEPRTREFRDLVRSMNQLTSRIQQMLGEESKRVEQLRQQAQIDRLTLLLNRETFVASLDNALVREDFGASGALVILRMTGLTELNIAIGRAAADQKLRRIGEQLRHWQQNQTLHLTVARLNAADFAILAADVTDPRGFSEAVLAELHDALAPGDDVVGVSLRMGGTPYHRGDTRTTVMARADGALAEAELYGTALVIAEGHADDIALPTDLQAWRAALETAIQRSGVQLGRFPVVSTQGKLLHHEAPLRLRLGHDWIPAARFIAWATRLGLMHKLDTLVVDAAFHQLERHPAPLSINLSPETISDAGFINTLVLRAQKAPKLAALLELDVQEFGALRHMAEFRRFCRAVKPLGYKLGLKHAGHQVARIAELQDLGIDYLKIDGSIISGIHESGGHEAFLRSLCTIAHTIGLTTIASGVSATADLDGLAALGIDGFTGQAIETPT